MKCKNCRGTGERHTINWETGKVYIVQGEKCPVCGGKGDIEQTNEEWFCQLPTEQKARWLYDHYVNARADEYYGRQEKTLSEYQKWLVSVHREIDGTKID